jgi:hypothetical protein
MNSGQIAGNHARGTSGFGGGVNVNSGTFTMDGGKISGNTASSFTGSGVYVYDSFKMSGSALVDTGNVVYLNTGTTIEITGDLTHNPAANITLSIYTPGTGVLTNNSWLSGNYAKFLVNGAAGKINSSSGNYSP